MARVAFIPVSAFDVVRPFKYGGKQYKPGMMFKWRQVSCDLRRLQQLYAKKLINVPTSSVDVEQDSAPDEIKHLGGGWYEVALGEETRRVHGREAALALTNPSELVEDEEVEVEVED